MEPDPVDTVDMPPPPPKKRRVGRPCKDPNKPKVPPPPPSRRSVREKIQPEIYEPDELEFENRQNWSLEQKKKLLHALKQYSSEDVDTLAKVIPGRSKDQIRMYIDRLRLRAQYSFKEDESVKKAPIQRWLGSAENITNDSFDYSYVLGQITSIIGHFDTDQAIEELEGATKDIHTPNYDAIYQFMTALLKREVPKELPALECAVVLDLLHNLAGELHGMDTEMQKLLMLKKWDLLHVKVDPRSRGKAYDSTRMALEEDPLEEANVEQQVLSPTPALHQEIERMTSPDPPQPPPKRKMTKKYSGSQPPPSPMSLSVPASPAPSTTDSMISMNTDSQDSTNMNSDTAKLDTQSNDGNHNQNIEGTTTRQILDIMSNSQPSTSSSSVQNERFPGYLDKQIMSPGNESLHSEISQVSTLDSDVSRFSNLSGRSRDFSLLPSKSSLLSLNPFCIPVKYLNPQPKQT